MYSRYLKLCYFKYHGMLSMIGLSLFSSPEPSGSQGELIVYLWSVIHLSVSSHFSNVFSSETAWPIRAKIYVEPPWEGRKKGYINDPGHMTKMATMLKNAQNLKKSSSPEPLGQLP